jgi:hypothetical protein
VGIISLSVSYTYNRQMTERVFWLYFAFLMVVETRLRPISQSRAPQQVPQPQAARQNPLSRMPPQVPRRRRLPPAYRARLDD